MMSERRGRWGSRDGAWTRVHGFGPDKERRTPSGQAARGTESGSND